MIEPIFIGEFWGVGLYSLDGSSNVCLTFAFFLLAKFSLWDLHNHSRLIDLSSLILCIDSVTVVRYYCWIEIAPFVHGFVIGL